jgi:predicted nucleic-acid-binding protein
MAALDTNVLVRFLVQDDAAQLALASKLFKRSVEAGETLFVPITVSLELEWVLRSNFGFAKPQVLQTFAALLSTFEVRFEAETALEAALMAYGQGRADFSDCLHASLATQAGEAPLWTFDKAASKVEGARLLSA